jgi:hypothetical protein
MKPDTRVQSAKLLAHFGFARAAHEEGTVVSEPPSNDAHVLIGTALVRVNKRDELFRRRFQFAGLRRGTASSK